MNTCIQKNITGHISRAIHYYKSINIDTTHFSVIVWQPR